MKASKNKKMTIDDLAEMIQRNVAMKDDLKNFATKDDLKNFATKADLNAFEKRNNERFTEIDQSLKEKATKNDIHALETKLIEDTGTIIGVEDKHYEKLTQRVVLLEREVFHKTV